MLSSEILLRVLRVKYSMVKFQTPNKLEVVGPDKLKVVASFCYLGDMHALSSRGCEFSTTTCVKNAWKKFKELIPVLSSSYLSFKTHGHVYSSCV